MLRIYTSNRAENLASNLSERLKRDGRHWTEKDTVLVQSKGMERWLNLRLAEREGVAANIEFPFPKSFVTKILRESVGLPTQDTFDKEVMGWRIYELLLELEEHSAFDSLKAYVADGNTVLKRYQLANRIADLFDQYLVFRPNTILSWNDKLLEPIFFDKIVEVPDSLKWQPILWRKLCELIGEFPYVKALHQFCHQEIKLEETSLPTELSLFGISSLPPILLNFFEKISQTIDVNIYYLSPCQQFWQDLVSEKRKASLELSDNDDYWEVGNPLLSGMGRLGRDFAMTINNLDCGEQSEEYCEATPLNLLSSIQNDILNLVNPKELELSDKFVRNDEDSSLQLVSCHSPLREVEVLYNHILKQLNDDGELEPRNILVMAPDIQKYAPYINAVFGTPEQPNMALPYCIADRDALQENLIAKAFLMILKLSNLRFTSVEVLDIFEFEAIRSKFGLNSADLQTIRNWVVETKICWGIDGDFRSAMNLPKFEENSWRFGIDRAMMGYAMADDESTPEMLPIPFDLEGSDATVIGRFLDFCELLASTVQKIKSSSSRTAGEWSLFLSSLIDPFFDENSETASEIKALRLAISALARKTELADFSQKIDLPVVTNVLKDKLTGEVGGAGFLQRGITFCCLLPMRSIPADMVCIMGLNDGEFPRPTKSSGFDLIVRQPMLGDRSMKNDDRYLFLEALLSARQSLYLSFIGQSAKDNTSIPPSVLVDELLDYIDEATVGDAPAKASMVQLHPLQSFSPDYFELTSKLFSFSVEAREGADHLLNKTSLTEPFVDGILPVELKQTDGTIVLSLKDLVRFYKNPAQYFLKNSLGINLQRDDEMELETEEPFDMLGGLDGYVVGQELLEKCLRRDDPILKTKSYQRLRAEGRLPIGPRGEALHEELYENVEFQAEKALDEGMEGELLPVEDFAIELECQLNNQPVTVKIVGQLDSLYEKGLYRCRWVREKVKDHIEVWLYHLVLNCLDLDQKESFLIVGKNKPICKKYPNLSGLLPPRETLAEWVELFLIGQSQPLCFFPESSTTFIKQMLSTKSELEGDEKVVAALKTTEEEAWLSGAWSAGEVDDEAFKLCFGEEFPGNTNQKQFISVANRLLLPMQETLSAKKGGKS